MPGLRVLVSCLVILTIGFTQLVMAQRITILSPAKGAVLKSGQSTHFELHVESTTSSVQTIAVTLGLKSAKDQSPEGALGQVVLKTLYASDLHLNPQGPSYNFSIVLPQAKAFDDQFSSTPYELVLSQYLLLGATQSPILFSDSTQVQVTK
ncbi:hypothetical protein MJO29_013878 [Puccinia striiformis f. sp. tritici]|uniref:Dolichyl-diphosphooligosaccharide--protein glycosyltransferase subunit 1 n=2 Tax=Puccinia striiformis TaxID=27350 RepID=A0A0L0W101_9BASI|nr:hypothetical protein Pst134EB_026096 [Puccinia striiformis f. sp. tritici]KAI7941804.1 hypothetical protein MJO29_013878 [Puccinia striiformis f. sp. tritici]KAI9627210.1 hypothetical protein KEM48_009954 [Puccinia striiformis f. sp. tritici PST-130]KNF05142.1 hypothetical protein PSTG_01770 [Puccinia striiformis f. sp. tritici PST-78]POW06054.1 hypothetical protein PSTT_09278 [Puccinia striiformis]